MRDSMTGNLHMCRPGQVPVVSFNNPPEVLFFIPVVYAHVCSRHKYFVCDLHLHTSANFQASSRTCDHRLGTLYLRLTPSSNAAHHELKVIQVHILIIEGLDPELKQRWTQ